MSKRIFPDPHEDRDSSAVTALTRRSFLQAGALTLAGAGCGQATVPSRGMNGEGNAVPDAGALDASGRPPTRDAMVGGDALVGRDDASGQAMGERDASEDAVSRVDASGDASVGPEDAPPDSAGGSSGEAPADLKADIVVPAGRYPEQKFLDRSFGNLGDGQVIDCSRAMFIQDSRGSQAAAHNFNPRIDGKTGVTIYRLRATGSMPWTQSRPAAYQSEHGNGTNLLLYDCRNVLVKEAFVGTDDQHCNWDHIKTGPGCADLTVEDSVFLFAFDDVSDNPRNIKLTYRRCWFLSMMGPAIENTADNPQTLEDCTIDLHQVLNDNDATASPIRHGSFFKHQGSAPLILHNVWMINWGSSHKSWSSANWTSLPVMWTGDCRILDLSHLAKHDRRPFDHETHRMPLFRGDEAVELYKQRKRAFMSQHAHMNRVWPDFFSTMERATGGHVPVPL